MDEAFKLPVSQVEQKEKFRSNSDTFRGSYKTYIHKTDTYKRKTEKNMNPKSDLNFYQLKDHTN